MIIRRIIIEEDYPVIKTWWERRGGQAPLPVVLPQVGVIAMNGVQPVACAFLYEDAGGRVAMVEWEATNPDCHSPMTMMRGLNMVFDFFEHYALETGYAVLLSWVAEDRGDGRLLERRKWVKCPGERHELMAFTTQREAVCP